MEEREGCLYDCTCVEHVSRRSTFSHAFWALELLTDWRGRIWSLTEDNAGSLGIQEVIIQGKPTNEYWAPVVSQVLCQVLGATQSKIAKMADNVPRGRG